MTFVWPEALVFLLVVPAFLAGCVALERQKRASATRLASMHSLAQGFARARSPARHIPLGLYLVSLTAVTLALARPQALTTMFGIQGTVVLALDVSASMRADDVPPSRLARAQQLAKAFVAEHSDELKIGLVAFGAAPVAVLDPTTQREELYAAIEQIGLQRGTAIGSGIAAALNMIFPEAGIDPRTARRERKGSVSSQSADARTRFVRSGASARTHASAAIILISDGQSASGPDASEAARLAADLGVRVHTIGVGTTEGKTMHLDGWSMRVRLDEAALRQIADTAHGEYLRGTKAIDWARLTNPIRPGFELEQSYTEVTALFAAAAAVAALAGAFLSLVWNKRIL